MVHVEMCPFTKTLYTWLKINRRKGEQPELIQLHNNNKEK